MMAKDGWRFDAGVDGIRLMCMGSVLFVKAKANGSCDGQGKEHQQRKMDRENQDHQNKLATE